MLLIFEADKEVVKIKNFIVQCNVANAYTKISDFKERELYLAYEQSIVYLYNSINEIKYNYNRKKIGMFVWFLAILVTVIMLIGNIMFDKKFSFTAMGLGSVSGAMLLLILSTKEM